MRQFSKGIDLYKAQMIRFERVEQTAKALHRDIADLALQDAIELTSGGISERTLRKLGHPFGRNAVRGTATRGRMRGSAKGFIPLLPINEQSHKLHDALRLDPIEELGATQSFGLMAGDVEYAKYILSDSGTVFMIGRGFRGEIRRRWAARNKAFIDYIRREQQR